MKTKLLKKLGINICVLSMFLSSSVLAQDVITGKNVDTKNNTWSSTEFTIPNKASYFNVDFKNDTDSTVTVKIMDSNGVYDSFEVDPNDQEYLKMHNSGEYYVEIDKENENIKGKLRVAYYE